ncbi:MAG: cation:dicarboxylase symporter family transporter [Holophaga sp.]|jgi:proton glutamate symport protein
MVTNHKKGFGLTRQILLALILGIACGLIFPAFAVKLKVLGDIFLRMIRMIVVPLVFSALVVGIAGTSNFRQLGRLSLKTLIWFEVATTFALVLGLLAANLVKPGAGVSTANMADISAIRAAANKPVDLVQIFLDIVPVNVFDAMSREGLLQIIFFSGFFGVATAAAGKRGEPIVHFADSVLHVMFRVTSYVMKLAPFCVFGTIAFTVGKFGPAMLIPLGKLILCLYGSLVVFVLILLSGASLICRVNFLHLLRAIKDPLMLAFSTASSETALPSLLERLQEFGVPKHIANFVLPTGYSFNLDGGTIYASMAVLFVSQAYGIHLGLTQQVLIILTLMVMTKGMAAVPGNAMVMLAATSAAFGLPVEGVALVLGIDRILDMGRTATNVIGNSVATVAVARWEHTMPKEVLQQAYRRQYGELVPGAAELPTA